MAKCERYGLCWPKGKQYGKPFSECCENAAYAEEQCGTMKSFRIRQEQKELENDEKEYLAKRKILRKFFKPIVRLKR
jgi:hypothetical protein